MPLGASFLEDVLLVEFAYFVLTRMPGGVTVSDSGLCCVPCLSSAICLLVKCWSLILSGPPPDFSGYAEWPLQDQYRNFTVRLVLSKSPLSKMVASLFSQQHSFL